MDFLKDSVYTEHTRMMAELKTQIHQTIKTEYQETLKNVFKNMKAQLNFVA